MRWALLSYVIVAVAAVDGFLPTCQVTCCDMGRNPRCKRVGCNQRKCVRGLHHVQCSTGEKRGGTQLKGAKVTKSGAWKLEKSYTYFLDQGLVQAMVLLFNSSGSTPTVLELGAGMGCYTNALREAGMQARGFDGAPNVGELTSNLVGHADLTKSQKLGNADWVFSFEVGEHVPQQFESALLDTMTSHADKGLVLSWNPTANGRGHVNPRNTSYLIDEVEKRGFRYQGGLADTLRRAITTVYWVGDSIMVFHRRP
jgi:hypothetical protein